MKFTDLNFLLSLYSILRGWLTAKSSLLIATAGLKVGKFANKNSHDQIFEGKNTYMLPKMVVIILKFIGFVQFFVVFNICICKTSPFFLAISKKIKKLSDKEEGSCGKRKL